MPETQEDAKLQERDRKLMARITEAKRDRERFATYYDEYYDLAGPTKPRVKDSDTKDARKPSEQDDIFDATLQNASENFAADNMDEFTPSYRPWTSHEAVEEVSAANKKRVQQYIEFRMDKLYETIRQSTFQEASQDAYHDAGIGPFAVKVRYAQRGPIDVEYIPLAQLLIGPAPRHGTGLRAWDRRVPCRFLPVIYPGINWSDVLKKPARDIPQDNTPIEVIEAYDLELNADVETWHGHIIVKNKVVERWIEQGRGCCPIIVGRTRVSQPSAYGIGPAGLAIPASRTLQRISYLELRRMGKIVDPPGVFSDPEGIFNPDAGFEEGQYYEIGDGFKLQDLAPQTDVREAFFKKDDLQLEVRRALFQDLPEQRGLTPPSASQWVGEQAKQERRKTLHRSMIYREWVLPLIWRFEWILEQRGEIDQLENENGDVIRIEPMSPLSRASDMEEAQVADQILGMFTARFGEQAAQYIKMGETFENIKAKMGDRLVSIKSDEEIQAEAMQMMAAAAAQGGAPGMNGATVPQ